MGAPNAMPGIQALTLSIAGRYDNYDGLESQFNPKVGFSWAPIDSLRIHGSTGDSYVAPNMGLITATFGVPQTGLRDNIGSTNYDFDIYNKGGGAPALEPEFAKSSTFGFSWQPAFAEGLSVGVTYYEVEYTNLVYKPRRSDVLDIPAFEQHRGFGPYDPVNDVFLPFSQEEVDQLIEFAPPQTPIVPVQTFNMWFDSYALNIGTRIQGGFDYNIRYNFDTSIGQWGLGLIANEQTRFDEEVVPGSGSFSRIGTRNAPGWQSRFQTQWSGNNIPLRVSLISMHKSGYANGVDSIESHLFHNLTLAYDIESWFNGVTLQARFRNLTDEEPPFFDSGTGYDDDNHTPYGRQMDLTLRASF